MDLSMLIATLVYLGFLASMPLKAKAATPPDGRMPSLGGRIAVSSHSLRLRYIASKPRNLHQRLDISERSRKRDPKKKKKKVLLRGAGQATFYYEKEGPGYCEKENGIEEYVEMKGRALCEPWQNAKTLKERNTNLIVALPLQKMKSNTKEYCGKEVIAHYKGKTIGGLIAWDGCVACDSNDGLDFSSTIFGQLVGDENCQAGRLDGLTWELTDKQVWDSNGDPLSSEDFSEDARAAYIKPAANRPATTTIRSSSLTKTTRSSSPTKTSRIGATVTSAKAQVSDPPKKNKPKKEKPKTEKTEKKKGKKTTKTKKKRPQKEQPNKKKEKKPAKSKETPTTSPHQAEIPEYFEADWENMEKAAQTTDVPFR